MKTTKKVMSIVLTALMTSGFAMAQKANVKGAEKIADKKGDWTVSIYKYDKACRREQLYKRKCKATRGSRTRSCSDE